MTDNELKRRFVMALDEVLPPAPALGARVNEALKPDQHPSRHAPMGGRFVGLGSSMRFAAGLAALLIAITLVAALLFSARLHQAPAPTHPQTPLASPAPGYTFTPTATTRSASWPQGGPVPGELAGCWQSQKYRNNPTYEVCLGQYSFDFGHGYSVGNVVVNGSEIDFISDTCTPDATFGYDRYTYTLTGSTLALFKLPSPGSGAWGNCGWRLEGSYTKA